MGRSNTTYSVDLTMAGSMIFHEMRSALLNYYKALKSNEDAIRAGWIYSFMETWKATDSQRAFDSDTLRRGKVVSTVTS
jgi:hypothetical protein